MDNETLEGLVGDNQLSQYRFGTHVTNSILKLLKRSDDRITVQIHDLIQGLTPKEVKLLLKGSYKARRLVKLRESLNELASEVTRSTSTVLGDEGKAYAAFALYQAADIAIASGVKDLGVKVSESQVYAAAMSRPMNGKHIRDHVKDLSANHRKEIMAAIRQGFVLGESTSTIMSRIRGTAEAKRKDGLLYKRNGFIENLIVRSSLTHIAAVASSRAHEELGVEEEYLSPIFDGRTSPICRAINSGGIVYYPVGQTPKPPLHPGGCRTIILARSDVAHLKPFVADKRPVSKIPKGERDDKIGRTKAPSFDAWLKTRPVAQQKEWLGPSRYKLWKGGVPLSGFADPVKGKSYNLAEIQRRHTAAFKEAGLTL